MVNQVIRVLDMIDPSFTRLMGGCINVVYNLPYEFQRNKASNVVISFPAPAESCVITFVISSVFSSHITALWFIYSSLKKFSSSVRPLRLSVTITPYPTFYLLTTLFYYINFPGSGVLIKEPLLSLAHLSLSPDFSNCLGQEGFVS